MQFTILALFAASISAAPVDPKTKFPGCPTQCTVMDPYGLLQHRLGKWKSVTPEACPTDTISLHKSFCSSLIAKLSVCAPTDTEKQLDLKYDFWNTHLELALKDGLLDAEKGQENMDRCQEMLFRSG